MKAYRIGDRKREQRASDHRTVLLNRLKNVDKWRIAERCLKEMAAPDVFETLQLTTSKRQLSEDGYWSYDVAELCEILSSQLDREYGRGRAVRAQVGPRDRQDDARC